MNDEQLTATRNVVNWIEENISDPEQLWLLDECKTIRQYLGPDYVEENDIENIIWCPRCIEDWEDEDGIPQKGTQVERDCPECAVCKDCQHLSDCSKADN